VEPAVEFSEEVITAIQSQAVPLVDTADSVLRRVLKLDGEPLPGRAGRLLSLLKAGVLVMNSSGVAAY